MSRPFEITLEGHRTEFGDARKPLKVLGAVPEAGVGPETGLLVVLLGRATPPDNPFHLKFRAALAERYDVVAVGVGYLGTEAQRTLERTVTLFDWPAFLAHRHAVGTSASLSPNEQLASLNGRDLMDCVEYGESLPDSGPSDYLDFGFVQALDVLQAVAQVQRRFATRPDRILGAGTSLGGSVLHLAAKLAPTTFAAVMDIGAQIQFPRGMLLNGHTFRGVVDVRHNTTARVRNDNLYSDDPGHPYFLSPRMVAVRDLLDLPDETLDGRRIVSVAGQDDLAVPIAQKEAYVAALRARGADAELVTVTADHVDGRAVMHAGHSLGGIVHRVIPMFGDEAFRTARNPTPPAILADSERTLDCADDRLTIRWRDGRPRATWDKP